MSVPDWADVRGACVHRAWRSVLGRRCRQRRHLRIDARRHKAHGAYVLEAQAFQVQDVLQGMAGDTRSGICVGG